MDVPRKGKKPFTATFGKKPIRRVKDTTVKDEVQAVYIAHNELIARLLATSCELCGREHVSLHGHHIRKLKDLAKRWQGKREKPVWVKQMIAIRRKTLFVCEKCHKEIHSGNYDGVKLT